MQKFLEETLPSIPPERQDQFKKDAQRLVDRTRQRLLGEVQALLATYNIGRQADLDLLRKEIDRIFLEVDKP